MQRQTKRPTLALHALNMMNILVMGKNAEHIDIPAMGILFDGVQIPQRLFISLLCIAKPVWY